MPVITAFAVALADGLGRRSDEQAVAAYLAHGRLDHGSLFQLYAEAARTAPGNLTGLARSHRNLVPSRTCRAATMAAGYMNRR